MTTTKRTPVEGLSGRKLDAAVAVEVMGFQVVTEDWPCSHPNLVNQYNEYRAEQYVHIEGDQRDYVYLPEDDLYSGPWPPHPETGYSDVVVVPHYSTSIQAAWEVVGHTVKRTRLRFTVDYGPKIPSGDVRWSAAFGDIGVHAETAPLAICRAALKAVRSA